MLASKFRLTESKYLADVYQEALQLDASLTSAAEAEPENQEEIADAVVELPIKMLVDLITCYVYAYNKLLEHELAISCTKKLINSDTLH